MRLDLYEEMYSQEEYYWWHKAKRKLVTEFLSSPPHPLRSLDIGCGTGKLMEQLQAKGQVWGIDHSPQAISFCKRRHLQHVYRETFPDLTHNLGHFDLITCLDVLEHISDDSKAVSTIKRLLKNKGRVIITVPAYPWLFSYWDKMLGHHRRYTAKSLTKLINASGLKIIKLSFVYSFLLLPVIPFRLIKHMIFKPKQAASDFISLPQLAHTCLYILARLEHLLIRYINLPFGLTLICVAQKP